MEAPQGDGELSRRRQRRCRSGVGRGAIASLLALVSRAGAALLHPAHATICTMSAQAPSESSPPWIEVREYRHPAGWTGLSESAGREYCRQIEQGGILYFSDVPDLLPQAD